MDIALAFFCHLLLFGLKFVFYKCLLIDLIWLMLIELIIFVFLFFSSLERSCCVCLQIAMDKGLSVLAVIGLGMVVILQ